MMLQELPFLVPGAMVRARGERWRVADVTRHEDCAACLLSGVGGSNAGLQRTLLSPFDRLEPTARAARLRHVGRRAWLHAFRARLGGLVGGSALRAAAGARFDLLPYQLEPALAVLRGESRLLLADEVGLGKTVQAALVLAELHARNPSARSLVLAPASLCDQWVGELRSRFDLPAALADARTLRQQADLAPPGSAIWDRLPLAVVSLDYVKRPEVLRALVGTRWDALVIDEAHFAALAPGRSTAARTLASRARHVLLLTATPHAHDAEGFRALCDIGRLDAEPPPVLFRRTRAALGIARTRRVKLLRLRLSDAELRLHRALERYTLRVWRGAADAASVTGARLAMVVLRKRAASGPAAIESSLARRIALLSETSTGDESRQLALPLDEGGPECEAWDCEPDEVLSAPGLSDPAEERRLLGRLLELARAASAGDTKTRVLARILGRAREPALVFTEYRDTLERLARELQSSTTLRVLHGGMDATARRDAVLAFTRGDVATLLATDAAAHGLNLQQRCRLVIDVELPWTPACLEQRIGRVDRIGQRRVVHALHMVGRATCEERVLARLVQRVARERLTLGLGDNPLGPLAEADIARLVFGDPLPTRGPDSALTRIVNLESPARDEAKRVEATRSIAASGTRPRVQAPLGKDPGSLERRRSAGTPAATRGWVVLRRRKGLTALAPGIVCLFIVRILDQADSLVEESACALHLPLRSVATRRALAREMSALLGRFGDALVGVAEGQAARRIDALAAALAPRIAAEARREEALESAAPRLATAPTQQGLFDRRADKAMEEQRRKREDELRESASNLDRLSAAGRLRLAGPPELVLVLGLAA
jgi:superfamily II DNA or RNA helicase